MKPKKLIPDCTEHVEAFAAYCRREPAWGIFHVVMGDDNYDTDYRGEPTTDEERTLCVIFDKMTGSQRAKVADLAWRLANGR